jgi:hypothetical protein
MRHQPKSLELETDPATMRKLVVGMVVGVAVLSGGIGATFYLINQSKTWKSSATQDTSMVPTSINGWQAQLLSGGKIKAGEFDQVRRDACVAIEAVNAGMPQGRRQPTCEQMHEMMRDPAAIAKAVKAMHERMR